MASSPNCPRPTVTLLFAVFISTLGTYFAAGFVNIALNVPQQFIVNWIRAVECRRRHTPSENHTTSYRLWCREVPAEEEHLILRDNLELSTVWAVANSVVSVGILVANLVCGYLLNRIGPKRLFYVAGGVFLCGALISALISAVHEYELLIVGRFLTGVAQGLCGITATIYVSEIAPVKLRGAFSTAPMVMMVTAMLFGNILGFPQVLGTDSHWKTLLALESIPVVIMCLLLPFCPESPRRLFLVNQDKEGATRALQWLRRTDDVREELAEMQSEVDMRERGKPMVRVSVLGIFKDKYLRYVMGLCAVPMFAKQFSGYMCIIFYSTAIFKSVGLSHEHSAYATCGLWAVSLIFALISMSLVDRLGRKTLLLISHTGMIISLTMFIVFQILSTHYEQAWAPYGCAASIVGYMASYAIASMSIPWFLPSELFPQEARSSAMTISSFFCVTLGLITTLFFPIVVFILEEYTFLIFVVSVAVSTVHIIWKLPETKGKTIEEIQAMLRLEFKKQ